MLAISIAKAAFITMNVFIYIEIEIFPAKMLFSLTVGRVYDIKAMSIKKRKYGRPILMILVDGLEKVTFRTWREAEI